MRTIKYERPKPEIETIVKKGLTPTDRPNNKRLKGSDSFAIKHDTIRKRVISILKTDKFARRNDLWLLLLYYHKMGYLTLKIDVSQFDKISMPESISRSRRAIYEEIRKGDLPELDFLLKETETLEIREEQEKKYREYFGNKKGGFYSCQ